MAVDTLQTFVCRLHMDKAGIGSLLNTVAGGVGHVLSKELVYAQHFLSAIHLYPEMFVKLLAVIIGQQALIVQLKIVLYQVLAVHILLSVLFHFLNF
jgi:hypothetical protein